MNLKLNAFLPLLLMCASPGMSAPQKKISSPPAERKHKGCHKVHFSGSVSAGRDFKKQFTDSLVFVMVSDKPSADGEFFGWRMEIHGVTGSRDHIYPVNEPIRFNPMQDFGPSYDLSAKESLSISHRSYFVISEKDFKKVWAGVTEALWPANAPEPEKAYDNYSAAVMNARLGIVKVVPTKYRMKETELDKMPESMNFSVTLTIPEDFEFSSGLTSTPAACPK